MVMTLCPFPESLYHLDLMNQWSCSFKQYNFPGSRETQQWQAWPDKTSEGGKILVDGEEEEKVKKEEE